MSPTWSTLPTRAPGSPRPLRADLHIHTALSPCASEEMTPPAIVATALEAGLDLIAISDHNTAGNVGAVQQAAADAGGALAVLPGMEITSTEEVHVLGLFPDLQTAEEVAGRIRALLPQADAQYYSFFGEQLLLAADGSVRGMETAALAAATTLDLTETVNLIHEVGGLAVAAHIDRKVFSVFSQLGFIPAAPRFDGVEVSAHAKPGAPVFEDPAIQGLPVTRASDGHYLQDIGTAVTLLYLVEPTFAELALAFSGTEERSVAHA